jgi:YHS domain-containing protein
MRLLTASLLTMLALFGCSSDGRDPQMAGDGYPTTDPVSKAEVRTDSPWRTEWNGDWYYFESEENLKKFEARPTSYVPKAPEVRRERRTIYPYDVQ